MCYSDGQYTVCQKAVRTVIVRPTASQSLSGRFLQTDVPGSSVSGKNQVKKFNVKSRQNNDLLCQRNAGSFFTNNARSFLQTTQAAFLLTQRRQVFTHFNVMEFLSCANIFRDRLKIKIQRTNLERLNQKPENENKCLWSYSFQNQTNVFQIFWSHFMNAYRKNLTLKYRGKRNTHVYKRILCVFCEGRSVP